MRKRHKKSEMPFAEALEFARKRLAHATKERDAAQKTLQERNAEIPSLQNTIIALEKQLDPESKIGQVPTMLQPPTAPLPNTVEYPMTVDVELSEDALLPEPEGTELIPE